MSVAMKEISQVLLISSMVLFLSTPVVAGTFQQAVNYFHDGEYEKAVAIWKPLAKQGNVEAQYALGALYTDATGEFNSPKKAFEWYQKAAEQGHLKSIFNIGNAYWAGQVTRVNREKAVNLWRQAAQQGLSFAQYNLASAYYRGQGVQRNIDLAIFWFNKAASKDDTEARQALEKLKSTHPDYFTEEKPESANVSVTTPAKNTGSKTITDLPNNKAPADMENQGVPGSYRINGSSLLLSDRASGVVLRSLAHGVTVEVLLVSDGWAKVRVEDGFNVWLYSRYATITANKAVINAEKVRARSLPSAASYSLPVGHFNQGEELEIIDRKGKWIQVRGTKTISAWVNFNHLTRIKQ